ncbi:MAG: DUF2069 domain-containing protein [gamma proteobacterium symbiont of Bathyaustriella thionipta]|nr:DUF2069 domain-containing protein [gamma proteobacterium symbiont of Bathyaustriella thionipta]MCU7950923.1 DUF2069 domain-containing protein [gamma proteobacterium symbiont of Bathyaustriella thionipta]MCU7952670.1 DUF2069 domain-containing protein [gamma proteobacterium symbiont of Bathyaustriella thionipta]MCU7957419.1 DUF2069 domain-containing protein [gamma proteobacterium symbiont of Bathyaustriella thionipta]MCU7967106.1 DUF2069 domain-containing protein [gamma proteobacterium symbion
MTENITEESKKLRFAQNLALTGYFSLLIVLVVNIVWLIPSRHFPVALVLIVIAGPLLFPMRGLLNNKTYTYQWASFLSLAYFAHGISEMSAYPNTWYAGLLETLSSMMMYLGCVMYARIFKRKFKQRIKDEAIKQEKKRSPKSSNKV